jgi:hypothetical protein
MRKATRRFLESRKRAAVSNPSSTLLDNVSSPLAGSSSSTPAAVQAPAALVENSTDQAFLVFPATITAANKTAVATAAPFDHMEADLPNAIISSTAGHSLPGSLKEQSLVDQSVAQSLPSTTVAQSLSSSTGAQSLSNSTGAQSLSNSTGDQSLSNSTAAHSLPGSTAAHSLPSSGTAASSLPSSLPSDTNFNGQQAGTKNDAIPLLLTQSVP